MILKSIRTRRRRRSQWRARGERRKRKTKRNYQVRRERWEHNLVRRIRNKKLGLQ